MATYSTACPRNCYSTCSFKVQVENNELTRIEPQPLNRATPYGVCLKGLSYVERAKTTQRILTPMRRTENGKFEPVSWEEALDMISSKILKYKELYGMHSIMFFAASGMSGLTNEISTRFWEMLGGATTVYGNPCWPAGLEATQLTLGANKHNAPWDLENAKLIILWGKNPAETNIHQTLFIENAIEKGAKVVAIDPRRTQSVENADLFLPIRPGTDAALALAVANQLFMKKRVDYAFLENHVEGYDKFRQSVQHCTVSWAARITGLHENDINKLIELIGTQKPMTIVPGYGMQRYTNGGQTIRSVLALQVLTGNIGKKGACWHYADLQSYIFDTVKEPKSYYPEKSNNSVFRRIVSAAKLGEDMLNASLPELKMIWVERGNPVAQNPDTNKTLKAFRKLEFRVVVEQFMTDTAREADIVLPAKNMFEQSDIIGSYWNPYIQLKQKVLEPAGEVKPESEIYFLLARRLGISPDEISHNIPSPENDEITTFLKKKLIPFPDITIAKLKKSPVLPPNYNEIAFSDFIFNTPSGKIEIFSTEAVSRWGVSPLPDYVPLAEDAKQNTANGSEFSLQLLSPMTKNRIHSQFNNLGFIRQFEPKPQLFIHPYDAEKRKIDHAEMVRVFNKRGELTVEAAFSFGIRQGCVSLSNGWWLSDGACANVLSAGRETDMGHGTAFHDNAVEVEKTKK